MKKGWIAIMAVLALFSFFGCKKNEPEEIDTVEGEDGLGDKAVLNESGISAFSYSYNGSIGGNSWTVAVERQDDAGNTVTYNAMEYGDLGDLQMTAGSELTEELERIYSEHKLYRWEGFSKSDTGVLDGSGFSLFITFNDGKSMSASGENAWPDGYNEFINDLGSTLAPYLSEMVEKAQQEKIDAGVSGSLNTLMLNFMQHGDSGSDKYEVLIIRPHGSGSRKSFDVQIYSESGDFIEPGKYNYYYDLPEDELALEEFAALFEKYGLIQWYGWDETAENYNDAEWFQLAFSFENGEMQAMGTAHPENYDEFRQEALQLLVKTIRDAEAKHDDFRSR